MEIYNYNKEKPGKKNSEVYLKFGLLGAFIAVMLIGGVKFLGIIIKLVIKHWIWVIVIIAVAFFVKHLFLRKKKVNEIRLVE